MIEVDIDEAQTHLKEYLAKAAAGEKVVLRGGPFERFELKQIEPMRPKTPKPRRVGTGVGQMIIHDSFYDPLPDDILAYFEGRGEEYEEEQRKKLENGTPTEKQDE